MHLLASARGPADLFYAAELTDDDATILYTRTAPDGAVRPVGRITADDIRPHLHVGVTVYICGSATFADAATERALEAGVEASSIRVERFGPTS